MGSGVGVDFDVDVDGNFRVFVPLVVLAVPDKDYIRGQHGQRHGFRQRPKSYSTSLSMNHMVEDDEDLCGSLDCHTRVPTVLIV